MSAAAPLSAERNACAGYSTRQVAGAVGLPPAKVRHFVRRGLLSPSRGGAGEYRFSFQDIVLLRSAKKLLDAEVSSRRTLAALAKLQALASAADKPASALPVCAAGAVVAVREDDALWDAQTGQGQIDFASERRGEVRELVRRGVAGKGQPKAATAPSGHGSAEAPVEADALDSDDWYNLGLDLEETDAEKAPEAYSRAIALNPRNADAHVNLGRLFQVDGDLKRATRHYQLALHASPEHQLAYYNLGTVFDELDELDVAVGYYRQAPGVPDAHYNLARIFELRGDELASRRHMRRYKTLRSASE